VSKRVGLIGGAASALVTSDGRQSFSGIEALALPREVVDELGICNKFGTAYAMFVASVGAANLPGKGPGVW
jgi:hypothetical protein